LEIDSLNLKKQKGVIASEDDNGKDTTVQCWIKVFYDDYLKKILWLKENTGKTVDGQQLTDLAAARKYYDSLEDKEKMKLNVVYPTDENT